MLGHPSNKSNTVAEATKRARTSVIPHDVSGSRSAIIEIIPRGGFNFPETPPDVSSMINLPHYPAGGLGGGAGHPSAPNPFAMPNTPPPGFGDPSAGTEYGAIPNRGAMMREIDAMMAGQGQDPQRIIDRLGEVNGGQRGIWGASAFPGDPNNAGAVAGDETGMYGGSAFPGDPNAAGASSVGNNPYGIGGVSPFPGDPSNAGESAKAPNPYGALMRGTESRDPNNAATYGVEPEVVTDYDRMSMMDPGSGWMQQNSQENIQYEAEQKLEAQRQALIEEQEARWGEASNKDEQEQYLKDMEKAMRTQMLLSGLAAWSGNAGAARMADMWGANAQAILNKKYEFAAGNRIAEMSNALMYDKNKKPDRPESREELYRALDIMGASAAERDYFDGLFFGDGTVADDRSGNYYNPNTRDLIRATPEQIAQLPNAEEYLKAGEASIANLTKMEGLKPTAAMREWQMYEQAYADWVQMPEGKKKDAEAERLARMARAFNLGDKNILSDEDKLDMFDKLFKGANNRYELPKDSDGKQIRIDQNYTKDKAVREWINSTGKFAGNGLKEQFARAKAEAAPEITEEEKATAVKVTSKGQYDSLESGTVVVDENGNYGRKP